MPFIEIKNLFSVIMLVNKVCKFLGSVSKLESNVDTFQDIGRVCLKVVFFFIIGNSRDSLRLGNWSR